MASPVRFPSGMTQARKFQPLGEMGIPNPLFYATFTDDFISYQAGRYVITANANGGVTQQASPLGRVALTTNSVTPLAGDITSMQIDAAAFSLVPTYKCAYAIRLSLADVTNPAFNFGLIQTTTTPFTVVDGIYVGKATGSTVLTLYSVVGSVVTGSAVIPYTPVNSTDFDVAIYYDGKGNVYGSAGVGLMGRVVSQNTAILSPQVRITPTSLTAVILNPTIALQSGTASSKVLSVDFLYTARER